VPGEIRFGGATRVPTARIGSMTSGAGAWKSGNRRGLEPPGGRAGAATTSSASLRPVSARRCPTGSARPSGVPGTGWSASWSGSRRRSTWSAMTGAAARGDAAMARPDLLRSWATRRDRAVRPGVRVARPGAGLDRAARRRERVNSMIGGTLADRTERKCRPRHAKASRRDIAAGQGPEMGAPSSRCTAPPPGRARPARHGPAGCRKTPGLAISATEDHVVGTAAMRRRARARAGRGWRKLEGLGHWLDAAGPAKGAEMLTGLGVVAAD